MQRHICCWGVYADLNCRPGFNAVEHSDLEIILTCLVNLSISKAADREASRMMISTGCAFLACDAEPGLTSPRLRQHRRVVRAKLIVTCSLLLSLLQPNKSISKVQAYHLFSAKTATCPQHGTLTIYSIIRLHPARAALHELFMKDPKRYVFSQVVGLWPRHGVLLRKRRRYDAGRPPSPATASSPTLIFD